MGWLACWSAAAQRTLAGLHQAIDARCGYTDQLQGLAGRMELLDAVCPPLRGDAAAAAAGNYSDDDGPPTAAPASFLEPQVRITPLASAITPYGVAHALHHNLICTKLRKLPPCNNPSS